MTKEEILAMTAGRELNIRVAQDVLGARFMVDEIFGDTEFCELFGVPKGIGHCLESPFYGPLRHYSEDMSAIQEMVYRLPNYNIRFDFNHDTGKWEADVSELGADLSYSVAAATAPEAICKATLLAMLEAKK